MLALIKNTFLKKIFLQCFFSFSMRLKTFRFLKDFLSLLMNLDGASSHIRHLLWTASQASTPTPSPDPEERLRSVRRGPSDQIQRKEKNK